MKFFFYSFLFVVSFSSCSSFVQKHGILQAKGNKIIDQDGNDFVCAGPSLFWGNNGWQGEKYYTESQVKYFRKSWNAQIIRAAMGVDVKGGYIDDPQNNQAKVERVVEAAIKHDMYVIIDFHSHHAEDYQEQAITFFEAMAKKYGSFSNVIYEIYNEPLAVSWDNTLKPYAIAVGKAIRKHDPDNLILVGTPNWSQDVEDVIGNPITSIDNIAYTLHFYAGTHGADLRNKAAKALDAGLPVFVSEWGTIEASGDGDVDYESVNEWLDFMKKNKLSHLNWSVCDKDEGASIFNPETGLKTNYEEEDISESGKLVRTIIKEYNSNN